MANHQSQQLEVIQEDVNPEPGQSVWGFSGFMAFGLPFRHESGCR